MRWEAGAIYVLTVKNSAGKDETGATFSPVLTKVGCNIGAKKMGGWYKAYHLAQRVAKW